MKDEDHETEFAPILPSSDTSNNNDPTPSRFVKFLVMLLICFVWAGIAFSMENLSSVQDVIMVNMGLSEMQYNLIFSFYSFPNIVLVIFGGIMVDKIGHRLSTVIFVVVASCGELLIIFGIYKNIYYALLAGRLLFGIGSESLGVSTSKYMTIWFDKFMLNLSFGIQVGFLKFIIFLSVLLTHRIYDHFLKAFASYSKLSVLSLVLGIGFVICVFSLICTIILLIIDKKYSVAHNREGSNQHLSENKSIFQRIKDLPLTFWFLTLYISIFYLPFSSYNGISLLYFQFKSHLSATKATTYLSAYSFVGMIGSPIFGYLIGKVGVDTFWYILAPSLSLIAHSLFVYFNVTPIVLMICRGISSVIVACSAWPSIRYVVPETSIGLAFGITQACQNLGLSLCPLAIAWLLNKYGYYVLEVFVQQCFSVTIIAASAIIIIDKIYTNGILSMTTTKKNLLIVKQISDVDIAD